MSKFSNVPVENDVTIPISAEVTFGDYDALFQKWYRDGVETETLIFANEDVEDDEIEEMVRISPMVKECSNMTTKHLESYTFANFNFDAD